ncbi:growth arrest-specific protein 2 isoform X2 [Cryptotermes secundus]|uniref:growth arrest-specific protein 2 isoform X2 n=1 Tax=Cryptotermes secundus TaxID=105785 RepID=UPI000CD7CE9B|nr:growth arrest-specific protein 2 isoform X2 [Cryptotermes secundus]
MTLVTMASMFRSTPGRSRRSVNSWGPMSLPSEMNRPGTVPPQGHHMPETEEECVEYYQDRIYSSQSRQLYPLQEDLADWINKTLGIDYITGENFLDMLDNGVVVCHLARVIQERAKQVVDIGSVKGPIPTIKGRCWENAARRSFFSRDNMENFIQFCRKLGVHQNLLFESDDLVLHNQPRNVILCLLEVSRLASRYSVEPPSLVQLEREIAEEESHSHSNCHSDSGLSHSSLISWQFQSSPAVTPRSSPDKIRHSSSSSAISSGSISRWGRTPVGRPRSSERHSLMLIESSPGGVGAMSPQRDLRRTASEGNTGPGANSGGASDGVPSDTTEDDWSRGSGEDPDLEIDQELGQGDHTEITELDRRVQQVARVAQRHCHCPSSKCNKLKVKKVGEGRYNIAGRNVFIRLLKGRHMMVRVGGGWDTLEHFLLRHDPCQVKVVNRDSPTNKSSSPSYLHIRAKYRSPPPSDPIGR